MKVLLKTAIVLVLAMTITSLTSTANANANANDVEGIVIWEKNGCDYYIIETNKFFVLVEWYKGKLYEGDKVVGQLHSYNFKYLINKSRNNAEVKVYIENYWFTKEECFKWLRENNKCGF
jgi:hypothetical protein